jgi:hypothetical protein
MPASRLGMCMPPTLPIPPPLTTTQSPCEAAGADGSEVYSEAPEVVLVWTRVPTRQQRVAQPRRPAAGDPQNNH